MAQINFTPEKLSDLIGVVYDSAFEEVQWQLLLDELCRLFPGICGMAYGFDQDDVPPAFARAGMSEAPFADPTTMFDMKTKFGMSIAEALEITPNGWVAPVFTFMDEQEYLNSTVYREHVRPEGFLRTIQLKVDHNGRRSGLLAFGIPEDPELDAQLHDPLFECLKLIAPHTVRASQLARALALAKKATEVFSGFLDGIILPMLVTDAQGKYLFGNAAGRRMLERANPFRQAGNGHLKLATDHDTDDLLHKLAQTNRDLVQSGLRVETDDAPLMLAISPFRPSMRDASAIDRHLLDEERMFAIFVGQSERDAVNTNLLEDVFDLTRREAEVCKGLLAGESVAVIAEAAGRSPKTVRNQIQTIYEKIGVSSNTELMDSLSVFRTVGTMFEGPSSALAGGSPHRRIGA